MLGVLGLLCGLPFTFAAGSTPTKAALSLLSQAVTVLVIVLLLKAKDAFDRPA